jgi:hypothetical protein
MRYDDPVRFAYVPFGQPAPARAAACDGLVGGAAIDLSHWSGNRTPPELKADTSVEIALAFNRTRGRHDGVEIACNNHFDADGVLACWVLLRPELAERHAGVAVAAAEAGDFDVWPGDERGLWLEAAIAALAGEGADRARYERVLPALDALVPAVERREDLWGRAYAALLEGGRALERGDAAATLVGHCAVFTHGPGVAELPGPWLSRAAGEGATRWLLAFEDEPGRWRYRYELPRWAWADTVRRPRLARPRRAPIRRRLGADWIIKGQNGMTGLAYTERAIDAPPTRVAAVLAELDAA